MTSDKTFCTIDELLSPSEPCPEELLDVSPVDEDIGRMETELGMHEDLYSLMEQLGRLAHMGPASGKMNHGFFLMIDSIGPLEDKS